jgi:hypothetical protein
VDEGGAWHSHELWTRAQVQPPQKQFAGVRRVLTADIAIGYHQYLLLLVSSFYLLCLSIQPFIFFVFPLNIAAEREGDAMRYSICDLASCR